MTKSLSTRVLSLLLCLLFTLTLISCDSKKDDIPEEKLIQTVLEALCAPEMRGRLAGTAENMAAVSYLAEAFKSIGLDSLMKDGYEWEYEQMVYDPDISNPSLKFICGDGEEISPVFGKDYDLNIAYGALDVKLDITRNIEDIDNDTSGKLFLITEKTAAEIRSGNFPVKYYLSLASEIESIKIVPSVDYYSSLFQLIITREFAGIIAEKDIVSVELKNKDSSSTASLSNVIGYLKGKDSTKAVVVSSHLDAAGYLGEVYVSGAIDNASGTAALAAIAKILSERKEELAIDVIFCGFNSEETGTRGSESFVKEIMKHYDEIYNINIDCIGVKGAGPYAFGVKNNGYEKELNEALRKTFDSYEIEYSDIPLPVGDHMNFESYKIPNVVIAQFGDENVFDIIHTKNDVISQLDIRKTYLISQAVADFIIDSGDKTYRPELSDSEDFDRDYIIAELQNIGAIANKEAERMKDNITLDQDEAYTFTMDIDGKTYYVTITGYTPYETLEQAKEYYAGFYVDETLGEYTLDSINIKTGGISPFSLYKPYGVAINEKYKINMNNILYVSVAYLGEQSGVHIEIMCNDSPAVSDNLTKLEGFENYYYQVIDLRGNSVGDGGHEHNVTDNDNVYLVYYFEPGLVVNFSALIKTQNGGAAFDQRYSTKLMTITEVKEMIDFLKIHENTDYYKAVANSLK